MSSYGQLGDPYFCSSSCYKAWKSTQQAPSGGGGGLSGFSGEEQAILGAAGLAVKGVVAVAGLAVTGLVAGGKLAAKAAKEAKEKKEHEEMLARQAAAQAAQLAREAAQKGGARKWQTPQATPTAAAFVFCGDCGVKNDAADGFCGDCGSKL